MRGACAVWILTMALMGLGTWHAQRSLNARIRVRTVQVAGSSLIPSANEIQVQAPPRVAKFCGTCHELPPPDCEPRFMWPEQIQQMYEIAQQNRPWPKTQIPPIDEVVQYYMRCAPDHLQLDSSVTGSPPSQLPFQVHSLKLESFPPQPAISHVSFVQLFDDSSRQLLACDMHHGVVAIWDPSRPNQPARILANIPHPAHATVVDLDKDGFRDVLVANLGVFLDADTADGTVVWLRGGVDRTFKSSQLFDGLGRVTDIQAADFDGDGDLDIAVAVFGHFHTGGEIYYENFTTDYAEPDFEPYVLDGRAGTIHAPIADVNQDGQQDLVVVLAQEHECIEALINNGRGRFQRQPIYKAPHPRWGATGIELSDMDDDGDWDVLFAHGDAFDIPPIARPYHGISWLENDGSFPFTYHHLTFMPGVHVAKPVDLDADGDLDVVASSFMPRFSPGEASQYDTVIWLEQTKPGEFQRQFLKRGGPWHASLDVADYDRDGDIDIALGCFVMSSGENDAHDAWVVLLESVQAGSEQDGSRRGHPAD